MTFGKQYSLLNFIWFLTAVFSLKVLENVEKSQQPFQFPFPRDGETVMLNCEDRSDLCNFSVNVVGWMTQNFIYVDNELILKFDSRISSNGTFVDKSFEITGTVVDGVFELNGDPEANFVTLPFYNTINKNTSYIPLEITIKVRNTETVVYNSHRELLAIHPSDVGIRPYNQSNTITDNKPSVLKMDFIEMGTANFDTCTHQAQRLLNDGFLTAINGISLDAMIQYLEDLPNIPGVTKVHAAMSTDPTVTALTAYYLPESLIDKAGVEQGMKGCTALGSNMHRGIKRFVRDGSLRPMAVQKTYIRALSVAQLLNQYLSFNVTQSVVTTAGGGADTDSTSRQLLTSVRLLKLDLEGMDLLVMHAVVEYYTLVTNSVKATNLWPCVVFFETNNLTEKSEVLVLLERLITVGYSYIRMKFGDSEVDESNALLVNYQCSDVDIKLGLKFLEPAVIVN